MWTGPAWPWPLVYADADPARRACWSPARFWACGCCRPRIAWWISRPLARRDAAPDGRADRSSCASCPQDLGASSRPSSAPKTTGCRPTIIRSIRSRIAHRTSPTNIGLPCWPTWRRYDFGYITGGQLLERTANALRDHATVGTPPRPLLQLVRHPVPEAAAAALHFHRGQREPRRAPADPAAGAARACRPEDPRAALCSTAFATRWRFCADANGRSAPADSRIWKTKLASRVPMTPPPDAGGSRGVARRLKRRPPMR